MWFFEECVFDVTVLSVIVLLPFALYSLCRWRRVIFSICYLVLVFALCGLFVHDYLSNKEGRRPWVPQYDLFMPFWFGEGGELGPCNESQISGTTMSFKISHVRRGQYGICVTFPGVVMNTFKMKREIHLSCSFYNKQGSLLFHCDSEKRPQYCAAMNRDYWETFCIYTVPSDVPLDDEIRIDVSVSGDVEGFKKKYPMAIFRVEHLCVK